MKKTLSLITLVGLILAPLNGIVLAQSTGEQNNDTLMTTTQASPTPETRSKEKTTPAERTKARKEQFKIRLSAAQKQQLKGKCKAAQGKVNSVGKRADGIATSRHQVYTNITDQLNKLVEKLKAKGVDTAALEAEIATLGELVTTFKTDLATYRTAVSDLQELDCEADPEAFQAALEAARASLVLVRTDAQAIKQHVKKVIRPLLVEIRKSVAGGAQTKPEETAEGSEQTEDIEAADPEASAPDETQPADQETTE